MPVIDIDAKNKDLHHIKIQIEKVCSDLISMHKQIISKYQEFEVRERKLAEMIESEITLD